MPERVDDELDALIVGGGVIGLACAWRAAARGLRVRVLERDRVGSGASKVAAGMLAPVGEATWGEDALLEMALESHRAWPRFATELAAAAGAEVGYAQLGALHVALDRDEAEELARRFELMRELGLDAEWLRPRAARKLEPGLAPACAGAIRAGHEAAADPRLAVAALRLAAERAGAEVVERVEVVEGVVEGGAVVGVRTAAGEELRAGHTVLASGAWSGAAAWLPAGLRPRVRPVKGEILTLLGPRSQPPSRRIVVSERVYVVPRADGRVVVGATVEERGFDLRVTAGGVLELLREAYRVLPDVAELELVEATAGVRPGTPDNLPLVGPAGMPGLLLATGHFRNGILLAPVTADAIVAFLAGDAPPEAIAAADPQRFDAGPRGILEALAP